MYKKPEYSTTRDSTSPAYLSGFRDEYSQIEYLPKILYKNNSRYTNLRTIKDDNGNTYHESWDQKFIDKSSEDSYFTVTLKEQNRLDIISNYFYSTPRYWWVIALANYIIDPFDVEVGTSLRIPPLVTLYNEGGVLSD